MMSIVHQTLFQTGFHIAYLEETILSKYFYTEIEKCHLRDYAEEATIDWWFLYCC